jgi:hypothetical protein
MLAAALESEVDTYVAGAKEERDDKGHVPVTPQLQGPSALGDDRRRCARGPGP